MSGGGDLSHINRRITPGGTCVRLRLICDTVASLDARHPIMLRELNVVEQRCQAVLEVLDGTPVTEVAQRFGVSRQTVHRWVARYRESGLARPADRSHAPKAHSWRVSAEVEAVICDLRAARRGWGPRRLVFEPERRGHPGISRSTVYRVLVRHHLAIAASLAAAHGGELTVDTEPGRGAAFHLRLPQPETFQVTATVSQGRLP